MSVISPVGHAAEELREFRRTEEERKRLRLHIAPATPNVKPPSRKRNLADRAIMPRGLAP